MVDSDAQQTAGRAIDLYEVITESGHGLFNDVL
jgi:hypothetical protein